MMPMIALKTATFPNGDTCTCAEPENIVRGGPTLMCFFLSFYS